MLLHAAAFNPVISGIALSEPLSSYLSIVANRFYRSSFIPATVAGALTAYDLPDLAAALSPRKLVLSGMTDGNGKGLSGEEVRLEYEVAMKAYAAAQSEKQLSINSSFSEGDFVDLVINAFR